MLSSSDMKTAKLFIFLSLAFLTVQASIFLTKLVTGALVSRAKTNATGLPPYAQTRQRAVPAPGPVTCLGSKGVQPSPGCKPDLRPSSAITPPTSSAIASEAPTAMLVRMNLPPSEEKTNNWRNHQESHRICVPR